MSKMIVLVGPPGSGKTSYAKNWLNSEKDFDKRKIRISQDDDGKDHLTYFQTSLASAQYHILIDRMGFNKQQRERYIRPAKEAGYEIEIIVLHQPYQVCLDRCLKREEHPTIKDEKNARDALHTFFTKYERPTPDEADKITFLYPEGVKQKVIICDLDGTLCNTSHREHLVKDVIIDDKKVQKKNWPLFFKELKNDTVNQWCADILYKFKEHHPIVYCSGRPDDYKKETLEWLKNNNLIMDNLFMRMRNDFRKDDIVKEIILDFEILTRYEPYFVLDDRKCVCEMWRRRGLVCLQVAEGDF